MKKITIILAALAVSLGVRAQEAPGTVPDPKVLTLEDCRNMAVKNDEKLTQARTKYEMAGYDRKIAFANYLPNISAAGAYMYNSKNISLIGDETSAILTQGAGAAVQTAFQNGLTEISTLIKSDPMLLQMYMNSPALQQYMAQMSQRDLAASINGIGSEIDKALHLDVHNIYVAAVSVQQPVFMGGKIIAANRIAKLAEDLQKSQYDQKYQETLVAVDQSYWQIVSVAAKLKMAEAYSDLLHEMQHNVEVSVSEGVATESDALQVKVKANEADMLKTKAKNGLSLAKMMLCKQVGLPLDTPVTLADENLSEIPQPEVTGQKSLEEIYASRPETRSLSTASLIYDKKVDLARADMMPQVALMANYIMTNPNAFNGFQNDFSGMFNAGVVVRIPIFHGFEALNKTRKAKAEATLYRSQLADAKKMINLEVTQLRQQQGEAAERLGMAKSNLDNAEENLRKAMIGYDEGVVEADVTLQAQTAWLQAHSEYIDAGIELQMNNVNIQRAEGCYTSDLD